jgi:hypothetical protein
MADKISPEDLLAKQEAMQQENMQFQMAMFELQQKAHRDQELMAALSSIEKGKDEVLKQIAANMK